MILLYAFSNPWATNVSNRTLLELQKILPPSDITFQPIRSYPQIFFTHQIEYKKYSLIIGMGDSKYNSTHIRIETQAKNNYLNREIYPFSPIFLELNLPHLDIYDSSIFIFSQNMGTYNCNWIAYRTQLYLNHKSLSTRHLFFHLPPKASSTSTAHHLHNLFQANHLI